MIPQELEIIMDQIELSRFKLGETKWFALFSAPSLPSGQIRVTIDLTPYSVICWASFPRPEQFPPDTQRELLERNSRMHLGKFLLNAQGDVILAVELPSDGLDAEQFRTLLQVLLRTYEDNFSEICGPPQRKPWWQLLFGTSTQ